MPNDQNRLSGSQGDANTDEIYARGHVALRSEVIRMSSIAISLLIIGGFVVWALAPANGKDLWVIIGPIISGTLSGSIGFLAGESQAGRKNK